MLATIACGQAIEPAVSQKDFDGNRSFEYLEEQVALGPRYPGSQGHLDARDHIEESLIESGWEVERQVVADFEPFEGVNMIGRANLGKGPVIILGAHYDTRAKSDQSIDPNTPTPGAVDGASGVAVLLELANSLDLDEIEHEIWLAFFDLEDNGSGGIEGWNWIIGSTYMAKTLTVEPEAMVLVDMVGDADQDVYLEGNSDQALQGELWGIAAELGYSQWFIPEMKYTIIDDHVPFAQRGIPAVDIIDFDYLYWHKVEDTPDKASAESLERVGRVVETWLEEDDGQ